MLAISRIRRIGVSFFIDIGNMLCYNKWEMR